MHFVFRCKNLDAIRTEGAELAWQTTDALIRGLELGGSATYAHSIITANAGFPAGVGKWQPRVPQWRATVFATYKPSAAWSTTLAARYSRTQYGQLDNSDTNGFSYQGFSRFLVVDARVRYQINRQWGGSFGIDNLNNAQYWASLAGARPSLPVNEGDLTFRPYPQRTCIGELKFARQERPGRAKIVCDKHHFMMFIARRRSNKIRP